MKSFQKNLMFVGFYVVDDGKIFHGSGVGDAFGPRCFKGDIMGCGIMFPRDYILDGEGDADDCERLEFRPTPAAVQNVLYLNDEEDDEEDGDDQEQDQDGRKVTVSLVCVYIQSSF
ncbi:SPRY domain-containing protein 3-like [Oryzias melastigma]|uniref:SPRY domain-containing protein 3-like n=1 Tax=Oryzias melastigma TaxID=30732 RepID=UPI00168D4321|nr:SPRY domain-containing protein 3-like [Oryzias melastigma]